MINLVFQCMKVDAWHGLSEKLRRALDELGFVPTPVQERALPVLLGGAHALVIAPTGIGKTEAVLLPLFSRLCEDSSRRGISLLYITPLRALNRDLMSRLEWWAERLGLSIDVRHGDTSQYQRRKQALSPPEVLITTPETLQALLTAPIMRRHLAGVRFVVVDEVHELIGSKRGAQLSAALERLREIAGDFQRVGISATVAEPERVARFIHTRERVEVVEVSHPKQMELRVEVPVPKRGDGELAERLGVSIDAAARVRRIGELVQEYGQVLIFVNTRETAEALALRCRSAGIEVGIHHSSLSQEVRVATEEDFRRRRLKALICTSSLELGIDIGSVELVVQYGSPRQVGRLIQRAGRSGHRHWETSRCVVIPADSEDALEAIAIAELAYRRELESLRAWEKPYDVLAHQLAGLALEYGEVSRGYAMQVLGRSHAFSTLTEEELDEVLALMGELRLLRVGEESFRPARGTRVYYYTNLSTIPDEKRYTVLNLVSRQRIGVLDEAFVVRHAEAGARIIFRGTPWRVVAVDGEEVKVEPLGEAAGAVPSWVGEDIPVPFAVARRVAELRQGVEEHEAADAYTLKRALAHVRRCRRRGFRVPGKDELLVELLRDMTVLHTQAGTRINETLSRAFSALLSARLGQSVRAVSDGYRVVLMCGVSEDALREMLELEAEQLRQVLELSLRRTRLYRWKFLHVARRFGAVERECTWSSGIAERVLRAYRGSVIDREALREVIHGYLDVEGSARVLEEVRRGRLKLVVERPSEPSPLALRTLQGAGELTLPERAEAGILRALKRRLLRRRVTLFCLYCASWHGSFTIESLPPEVCCGNCGARRLAVLKRDERELMSLYRRYRRGEKLTPEQMRKVRSMQLSGELFLSYGRLAVVAQAGFGTGAETAKRILSRAGGEEGLYREILRAEREYARTRQYW